MGENFQGLTRNFHQVWTSSKEVRGQDFQGGEGKTRVQGNNPKCQGVGAQQGVQRQGFQSARALKEIEGLDSHSVRDSISIPTEDQGVKGLIDKEKESQSSTHDIVHGQYLDQYALIRHSEENVNQKNIEHDNNLEERMLSDSSVDNNNAEKDTTHFKGQMNEERKGMKDILPWIVQFG